MACSGVASAGCGALPPRDRMEDCFARRGRGEGHLTAPFAKGRHRVADRFAHRKREHERRFADRLAAVNHVRLGRLGQERDVEDVRRSPTAGIL